MKSNIEFINKKRIAILVPTTPDGKEHYDKMVESLSKTVVPYGWEFVVVRLLNDYEGFAKTVNAGIKEYLDYDLIGIFNDDIELMDGNWLVNMLNIFSLDEKIGIVTDRAGLQGGVQEQIHPVFFFSLIKSSVFKKVGLFDEQFHPAYVEDIDFDVRCIDADIKFACLSYMAVKHDAQSTFGKNPDKEKIIVANWQKFKEKWKGSKWENFKEREDEAWNKMIAMRRAQQKFDGVTM